MVPDFRRCCWINLALTVPILALSQELWELDGRPPPIAFARDQILLFALSSAVYFYSMVARSAHRGP